MHREGNCFFWGWEVEGSVQYRGLRTHSVDVIGKMV